MNRCHNPYISMTMATHQHKDHTHQDEDIRTMDQHRVDRRAGDHWDEGEEDDRFLDSEVSCLLWMTQRLNLLRFLRFLFARK